MNLEESLFCLFILQLVAYTDLLPYLLHGAESFLRSQLVLQLVKKFPAFLEPEGSSPYPQAPAICPYPEPTTNLRRVISQKSESLTYTAAAALNLAHAKLRG